MRPELTNAGEPRSSFPCKDKLGNEHEVDHSAERDKSQNDGTDRLQVNSFHQCKLQYQKDSIQWGSVGEDFTEIRTTLIEVPVCCPHPYGGAVVEVMDRGQIGVN
jgi:hypothetical protein